jgi:hypothetical protein
MFLNIGDYETATRVINTYVGAWLHKQNPPALEELAPDASPCLKQVIHAQNSIGLEQWFYTQVAIL